MPHFGIVWFDGKAIGVAGELAFVVLIQALAIVYGRGWVDGRKVFLPVGLPTRRLR